MSICKGCGAHINWIHTKTGKTMPVDEDPVMVIEGEDRDVFVTNDSDMITGRRALPQEEIRELPVAFVPHWATCPAAGDFRRKRR